MNGIPQAKTHELKIEPRFFLAVVRGFKRFEIRQNDRAFHEGDTVVLREWLPAEVGPLPSFGQLGRYTGRQVTKRIGFLTDYAQQPGYVVFSLV